MAIPFLIAASRYRNKARNAKDANNLEAMRFYVTKAKKATTHGKNFADLVTTILIIPHSCLADSYSSLKCLFVINKYSIPLL